MEQIEVIGALRKNSAIDTNRSRRGGKRTKRSQDEYFHQLKRQMSDDQLISVGHHDEVTTTIVEIDGDDDIALETIEME